MLNRSNGSRSHPQGHKLKYPFRIILLSLISRNRVLFLVLWKKFKISVIYLLIIFC